MKELLIKIYNQIPDIIENRKVREYLKNEILARNNNVTIEDIIIFFKEVQEVDLNKNINNRNREHVEKRQIAYYLCKNYTKETLYKIGEKIGSKIHATVLNGIRRIENFKETDREFRYEIEHIENQFKNWIKTKQDSNITTKDSLTY